jgi:hypothetical protein
MTPASRETPDRLGSRSGVLVSRVSPVFPVFTGQAGQPRSIPARSVREETPSFGYALYRWNPTVRGLRKSWAAICRFVTPVAASRTTCSS